MRSAPRPTRRTARWAFGRVAGGFVSAVLCCACTTLPRAGTPRAPAVLPSAEHLARLLRDRRAAVQSLRALAHLHYRDPHESSSSREALIVDRPDRVRVEVLSVFGSLFVLTAENGAIAAYARQEDTVYRGRASSENLSRYARLWMPIPDLVDLVLGTPPMRPSAQERVTFDSQMGAVRWWRALDRGAQVVWFSDKALPVAAEELGSDGSARWQATYAAYEQHEEVPIATQIRFELPTQERVLDLTLDDVDINPALDESVFDLQVPPGSKVINIDTVAN